MPEDIRYTASKDGNVVYAFSMARPAVNVRLSLLGSDARLLDGDVSRVEQLGAGEVKWEHKADALVVTPDLGKPGPADQPVAFRVTLRR